MSSTATSNEALLRQFLDAVPDMLILGRFDEVNHEIVIIAVNATTRNVTGLTDAELIGVVPRTLMAPGAIVPTLEQRRAMSALARERGVFEYPGEARLRVPENGPRLRIRMVWPDPAETLVLLQVEVLKD